MKCNCVSYALKLETTNLETVPNLNWQLEPVDAVSEYCNRLGISCRSLESLDSPISKGEWVISFWGFISNYDPDNYGAFFCRPDYHFACKCEDGIWRHRMTWGADVEEIDIEKKIAEFQEFGYAPHFFAVKKTED